MKRTPDASREQYAHALANLFANPPHRIMLAFVVLDTSGADTNGAPFGPDGSEVEGQIVTSLSPVEALSHLEIIASRLVNGLTEDERAAYFGNRESEWDIKELLCDEG